MKILIVNPNTNEGFRQTIHDAATGVANPGTEIVTVCPKMGPDTIENFTDTFVSAVGVMQEIRRAEAEGGYDAYINACYDDPGLLACREIATGPVVGIGEATMYMASMVAAKFSIITDLERTIYGLEELVKLYGLSNRLASVRSPKLNVLEINNDLEKTLAALTVESHKAVEEDGAEAILLGCAGMVHYTNQLQEELGVPVFDGVCAAVKLAEGLVCLGKKTSKICTYGYPEKKKYLNTPNLPIFESIESRK